MSLYKYWNDRFEAFFRKVNSAPRKYSIILLVTISVIEICFVINGQWAGDFWEHCAVLKELIRAPLAPTHPILSLDLPHAFFSPYSVTLGFIGKALNASPITMLSFAGVMNLFLWLYGLFLLIKIFYPDKVWNIYFYVLILHLFAWGPFPWNYSSFFDFSTLHYNLPYPSTFAVALGFISAYLFSKMIELPQRRYALTLVITVLNSIILLSHPTSFLLIAALTAVISFKQIIGRPTVLAFIFPVLCLFGPLAVVSLWPYYPFWDLFLTASSGSQFHTDSKILYENVFIRIAPALFAFFLISKKDLNYKNEAILLFIALLIIYIYGIFSGHFGYGRVISFMVLALHILIAYKMSTITTINRRNFYVLLLLIVSCLPYSYYSAKTFYVQLKLAGHKHYRDYEFLAAKLNYNDVVVADSSSLRLIPAFGGRVTASVFPPYWITDNTNRLNDLTLFFSEGATTSERKSILDKYHAKFILLDKEHAFLQNSLVDSLHLNIEYQNDQFKLLKTKE